MKSKIKTIFTTFLAMFVLLSNVSMTTYATENENIKVKPTLQKSMKEMNVALTSNGATVSSTDNISNQDIYAPDKAIDGKQNTWWGAAPGGTKIINITLAKVVNIERANVIECTEWGTRIGGYKIEVAPSEDSNTYSIIAENKTGSSDMSVNITKVIPAKKVRVTF